MTLTAYSAVNGPRPKNPSRLESVTRALAAEVALAREAALLRDTEGERIHHDGINELLATRERLTDA